MNKDEPRDSKESQILLEIKSAEKKADDMMDKARQSCEAIVNQAAKNSSIKIGSMQEEIIKSKEKKILDFKEKLKLLREEKIAEGKAEARQIKSKAAKNIPKAVSLIMEKFEETINA